jgi:hypothetical protein
MLNKKLKVSYLHSITAVLLVTFVIKIIKFFVKSKIKYIC